MNLKAVSKKIRFTRLFSDAQKVEILSMLPEASKDDVGKLEAGIDAFDKQFKATIEKRSREIMSLLTDLMKDMPEEEKKKHREAIDEITMGLALIQPVN